MGLDVWQWGVLGFVAGGWALSEVVIGVMRRRAAEDAERIVTELYRATIEQIRREER